MELGAHIGPDAPVIFWESGAGSPQSGSFTFINQLKSGPESPHFKISSGTDITTIFKPQFLNIEKIVKRKLIISRTVFTKKS